MKERVKKIMTDEDVKKKAIKLVITHLKKKASGEFIGSDNFQDWVLDMEDLLKKEQFVLSEYIEMRRNLNDVIERTIDVEMRYKLRDSWYSLGKALDKKAKAH
jgi:hypothetical protein